MHCPRCQSDQFKLTDPCPQCDFTGEAKALEHLSNLKFLLAESFGWPEMADSTLQALRERYGRRLRDVERELNLRPPILSAEEAQFGRLQIQLNQKLLDEMVNWHQEGWLAADKWGTLQKKILNVQSHISDRLVDSPTTDLPFETTAKTELKEAKHITEQVGYFAREGFLSKKSRDYLLSQYNAQIQKLEEQLGLRPIETKGPVALEAEAPLSQKARPSKPTRQPWSWDRVWESLLSERTLQAILFLGAMLLFAAGVSWVAWNWGTFTPVVQVAFLGGFTALFYGLGAYVYRTLNLRGSGIALFGVGSLLIPLDFYAYYLSGGFPPDSGPAIWLVGSLVCLVAYLIIAFLLQAEFFGYLIGLALGSGILAGLNLANTPLVWWQTAVSGTGFVLGIAGFLWLSRRNKVTPHFLAAPFQRLSLLLVGSVMLIGLSWRFFFGTPFMLTVPPLAINWWMGGVILTAAVPRLRLPGVAWAAAVAYPIASWFTAQAILPPTMSMGWYAVGWAGLVPVYLLTARQIAPSDLKNGTAYGRIVLIVAGLITTAAAGWSISNSSAASVVHPLLALAMVLAAWLWLQPRWLWVGGLLSLSGTAAWQGARGVTLPEVILPWGLLALLFILLAIRLQRQQVRYDGPLFGLGWLTAALMIGPPLILNDRGLLLYGLTSWIGVNSWMAMLAYSRSHQGLQLLLSTRRIRWLGDELFHWSAAVAAPAWLWLLWTNSRSISSLLGIGFVILAGILLGVSIWVRRFCWRYGRAWLLAGHLSVLTAVWLGFSEFDQPVMAVILMGAAIFYFASAWVQKNRFWLVVGGVGLPFGWMMLVDYWLDNVPFAVYMPLMSVLVLLYALVVFGLSQRQNWRDFIKPLYGTAVVLGGLNLLYFWTAIEDGSRNDFGWLSLSLVQLALAAALFAWIYRQVTWAHITVWLGIGGAGLLVLRYSTGSGRSAMFAALLAVGLILVERGCRTLTLRQGRPFIYWVRRGWRLYRVPLKRGGWMVASGTIGLALVRNLIILDGGLVRQTWSTIALLILVGLYGVAAWLYRQPRFVYFSAALFVVPWSLATDLRWPNLGGGEMGLSWTVVSILLLGVTAVLAFQMRNWRWVSPTLRVATFTVGLGLLSSLENSSFAVWAFGLGVMFFTLAVWLDRTFYKTTQPPSARYGYPLLSILPIWAAIIYELAIVNNTPTQFGLLTLTFSLPALGAGYWIAKREPSYRWPFYVLAYGTAVVAMILVGDTRPVLIVVLFFNTALAVLSVWLFREPIWWYPAALLLPFGLALQMQELGVFNLRNLGWLLIGLGAVYLLGAWLLSRQHQSQFAFPLLVMSATLTLFGLLFASDETIGVAIGFAGGAAVFAAMAIWKRWPILLFWVSFLIVVAYGASLFEWEPAWGWVALSMWPGILGFLGAAIALDHIWGIEPLADGTAVAPFPWENSHLWLTAVWHRLLRWWGLPLYLTAFAIVPLSSLLGVDTEWQWLVVMLLGTAVYSFGLVRFQLRLFLLLAWLWLQFSWATFMNTQSWFDSPTETAYFFLPMTVLTAVVAILIETRPKNQRLAGRKWALPLYILFVMNIAFGEIAVLIDLGWQGGLITAVHGLLIALLATLWGWQWLAYAPLLFWAVSLGRVGAWADWQTYQLVPFFALLALVYGVAGYGWRWRHRLSAPPNRRLAIWERPLIRGGWVLSGLVLLTAFGTGGNIFALAIRGLFGVVALRAGEVAQTNTLVVTLAILGLFFLIGALAERRPRLGYASMLLLLISWTVWLRLIGQQVEIQLYAIPAVVYLLGIGWFEYETGLRPLARWIDRLALLLLFGSVFWQSLTALNGAAYALLMIIEGLLIVWIGSWRRLRRLLYAGVTAVVVALLGQLVAPLLALNTWVLLLLGAILVTLGIVLERRLENVRTLSKEFRQRLESWE